VINILSLPWRDLEKFDCIRYNGIRSTSLRNAPQHIKIAGWSDDTTIISVLAVPFHNSSLAVGTILWPPLTSFTE